MPPKNPSCAQMPCKNCWRFGALIVLFVVFSLASPNFFQFSNIVGILLATAVNGVLALGVTFVIITGGIDLSVGTVMTSFSAVMAGVFITYLGGGARLFGRISCVAHGGLVSRIGQWGNHLAG